jgi:hypothetical protein
MTREQLTVTIERLINESLIPYKDKVNAIAQVLIDMGVAAEPDIDGPLTIDIVKDIEKAYYTEPTIGKALILQGVLMLSWGE